VVKILMPFLSSISWSGMPTGGFCQGIRWVTEFGQANATSPTWARWGISLDRAGIAAGVAIAAPLDSNAGYGGACRFEVDVAGEAL
jgi:hypothetical protein